MSAPLLPDLLPPLTDAELATLFPARRVPTQPTLIRPGFTGLEPQPTLAHLADAVARLLGPGRRPVLNRSVATYPGYDTFPVFSVHGENVRGLAGGPCSASYVCAVAVQATEAEALDAAIAAAQARLGGAR